MADASVTRIVVSNAARLDFDSNLSWDALEALGEVARVDEDHPTQQAVLAAAADPTATVLVNKEIPIPAEMVEALPSSVKLICEAGTGYNNIALKACAARGITVCNVPAYSSEAVAQLVITFVLSFSASLPAQTRLLAGNDRRCFAGPLGLPHFELRGRTIGLIGGRGGIGSRVATLAEALGMSVLISSRRAEPAPPTGRIARLDEVLAQSDFVSVHCPLNDETLRLIDARALATMKPTAYLINTARGKVVDEPALIMALEAGTIAGAALDVQETEPPPPESPLYRLPNVVLTPHIGWKRLETRQRLVDAVAFNIAAFLEGKPQNVVG